MDAKGNFKIVIVGGSVTGLGLANMLQMHGIDFIVLEAYQDIAPQVGASIGMLPNGNRILDQLGLFEEILKLCPPLDSFHFRDQTGNVIREFRGMNHSMRERHSYPVTFLDRQMVLQVLYDNIRDKKRVCTNKRVVRVETMYDGAVVTTSDGSFYEGDIVVGADGIHSSVRSEMWRLANETTPGWFPHNEHSMIPCDYGCIFGISNPCKGIEPGSSNSVFRRHESYVLNGGPGGRVYWFYFFKLPRRAYGRGIPRYTKADEEELLALRANDNITPTLKFKTILEEKISSVLVPLQEYVFKRWFFKRIITIGDAAHKFNPIGGQGGNACLESAAVLVNQLRASLALSQNNNLTPDQIKQIFAKTQEIRMARTISLKNYSHEQQRLESRDTPLHHFVGLHILPLVDTEDITFNFSSNMPFAEKLDSPELPSKPRLIPYKDDLWCTPSKRGSTKWLFIAVYLLVAGLVHYGMWIWSAKYELGPQLETIIATGQFPFDPEFRLKRTYVGIKVIDDYLVFLAAIFMPGLNLWNENFGLLQRYFLMMLIQPITVWFVEAYRKRNLLTPLSLFSVWLTLVQLAGVGIYMPIFYAIYTYVSEAEPYWWPLNREVRHARFILWAVIMGYALPTFLMFWPWKDPFTMQIFEGIWQISPLLVSLLCNFMGQVNRLINGPDQSVFVANKTFPDMSHLKKLYISTGVLGLFVHVYYMFTIVQSSTVSLWSVFGPDFSGSPKELGEGLHALFMADFWGLHIATYVWLCMATWDLKRMGRVTVSLGKVFALLALSYLVAGPGATISAVWYWREIRLAKTSFSRGS